MIRCSSARATERRVGRIDRRVIIVGLELDGVDLVELGDHCAGSARRRPRRPTGWGCRGAAAAGSRPRRARWPRGSVARVDQRGDAGRCASITTRTTPLSSTMSSPIWSALTGWAAASATPTAERRDAVAGVRRRVQRVSVRPPVPTRAAIAVVDHRLGPSRDRGVVPLGVVVHPGDRAARQDVVELLQQHQLPELARARRTGSRTRSGRRRSPPTARPRAAGARCAGCPAWSGPGWCRCRGAARGTSRRSRPADARTRRPPRRRRPAGESIRTVGEPSSDARPVRRREHLPGRAAAAVAVPERHQRAVGRALLAVLPLGARQVGGRTGRCCRCRPAGSG